MRPPVDSPKDTHPMPLRIRLAALPVALLAALPAVAQPLRVDYVLGASVLHTDNINLSDDVPESETVVSPEISFTAHQASSSTTFRARGRLQYLDYLEGSYGNESRSEFAGQFTWMALPQRLAFVVEDYLGRQPIDFTAGYSPGNQQQVNVLTAGPTLFTRFGSTMRGQIDLRYSDTHAEETREFNGNRQLAAGRLFRDLGPDQWISLNVDASRVRFDIDAGNSDYERYDAYVRYRRESARFNLDASAGHTRLEQDGGAGSASSPLALVHFDWLATPRSVISADATYRFADTASELVANSIRLDELVIGELSVPNGLVGPSVYRQRRYELGYRYAGERWDVQVRPYTGRVDYEEPQLVGWSIDGAYADVRFRIQPRLALTAAAMREDREFLDGSREDRDLVLRLALAYQFSNHLSGAIGWQRLDRDSSVAGQDYRENAVTASISWRR